MGIVYCNGLPDLMAVKVPLLQEDMINSITNQRWLEPVVLEQLLKSKLSYGLAWLKLDLNLLSFSSTEALFE